MDQKCWPVQHFLVFYHFPHFLLLLFLFRKHTKHSGLYGEVGIRSQFEVEVLGVKFVSGELGFCPQSLPRDSFKFFCKILQENCVSGEPKKCAPFHVYDKFTENTVPNGTALVAFCWH